MISLKLLTKQDILLYKNQIINLLKQSIIINFSEMNCLDDNANMRYKNMQFFIEEGSAIIIGAIDERKELSGFLWAYERTNIIQELFITELVITENQRSKGIGRLLINQLTDIAKDKKISKIGLTATYDNTGAMNFYSNNGFITERVFLRKDII